MKKFVDIVLILLILAAAVYVAVPHQATPAKGDSPIVVPELRPSDLEPVIAVPAAHICPCGDDCQCDNCRCDVAWMRDYGAALNRSKRSGQPLVLLIKTANCVPCEALAKTLETVDLSGFVKCRIDESENRPVVDALEVTSYPALVVAGSDGNWRRTDIGVRSADEIKNALATAFAPPPPLLKVQTAPPMYGGTPYGGLYPGRSFFPASAPMGRSRGGC